MKRKLDRKLSLSRETLWNLTDSELGGVAGGRESITPENSCTAGCCTNECTVSRRTC